MNANDPARNASMITEYGKNMLVYTYEIDFLYKSYTPHS